MNRQWRTLLHQSGRFRRHADIADAFELQQLNQRVLFDLAHLAIIKVSGADALSFLNAQFSNDVTDIAGAGCQFNAWCNPKGQVISFFLLAHINGAFFMLLPEEVTAVILQRLNLFKLRADVMIEEASNTYNLFGATDIGLVQSSMPPGDTVDCPPGAIITYENRMIIGLPAHADRLMILSACDDMQSLLQTESILITDAQAWQYLDIKQGIPLIGAKTSEQFLPQMLNLDLLAAMSLSKGCFPGQEVIARLHYRGTVKRRVMLASANAAVNVGDALAYQGNDRPIGTVLCCARERGDTTIMLVVIELNRPDSSQVCVAAQPDRTVTFHSLPYPINAR